MKSKLTENINWMESVITIDDVWDDLLIRGIIKMKERLDMRKLSHIEQQKQIIKYKNVR